MKLNWSKWLAACISAVVLGGASSVSNAVITPELFQHMDAARLLTRMALAGALTHLVAVLMKSPIPEPEPDPAPTNDSEAVSHGNNSNHPPSS